MKACRRLHNAHNEYVLLLLEASQYERDFRTVLLPALLEYQQLVQEDMVERWSVGEGEGRGREGGSEGVPAARPGGHGGALVSGGGRGKREGGG